MKRTTLKWFGLAFLLLGLLAAGCDSEETRNPEYEFEEDDVQVPEQWEGPISYEQGMELLTETLEMTYLLNVEQEYLGGPKNLVESGLLNRANAHSSTPIGEPFEGYGSLAALERLSGGLNADQEDAPNLGFTYYNPEIIGWGIETLLPLPDQTLGEHTAEWLYQNTFKRFFRLLVASHVVLDSMDKDREIRSYKAAARSLSFQGANYLGNRYQSKLADFQRTGEYVEWTPHAAIGFWLRRNLDGTADELWRGLDSVMVKYDEIWWKSVQRQDLKFREVPPFEFPQSGKYGVPGTDRVMELDSLGRIDGEIAFLATFSRGGPDDSLGCDRMETCTLSWARPHRYLTGSCDDSEVSVKEARRENKVFWWVEEWRVFEDYDEPVPLHSCSFEGFYENREEK